MTKQMKRSFLKFFFGFELLVFGATYFYGAVGVKAIIEVYRRSKALESAILVIQGEIEALKARVFEWESDAFYKEKAAREKLHMANKDDMVYFIHDDQK